MKVKLWFDSNVATSDFGRSIELETEDSPENQLRLGASVRGRLPDGRELTIPGNSIAVTVTFEPVKK